MHEISLVAELLDECVRRADGRAVSVVRVRHANTIPDDVLEQAFAMLTVEGPLAGAQLQREEFDLTIHCAACGYDGILTHDHAVGHMLICPRCSDVSSSSHPVELELLGVDLTD